MDVIHNTIFIMRSDSVYLQSMWSVIYFCYSVRPYPWNGCYDYQVNAVVWDNLFKFSYDAIIPGMIAHIQCLDHTCYNESKMEYCELEH